MKKTILALVAVALTISQAVPVAAQTASKKTAAQPKKTQAAPAKPAAKPAPAPAVQAAAPVAQATPAAPEKDLFAEAVSNISSENETLRRQAALYLAGIREERAVPHLETALTDASPQVRKAAIDGLGQLSRREAAGKIAAMLSSDKEATVRQQAAIVLTYLGGDAAGPALVKALQDEAQPVRFAAINAIGTLRYAPAEAQLLALLKKSEGNTLRLVISTLGKLQSAKALGPVVDTLTHADHLARYTAARALGEIGSAEAVGPLEKALPAEKEPLVKAELVLSLAKLGSKAGVAEARTLAASKNQAIMSQALAAIVAASDFDSLPMLMDLKKAETNPAAVSALDFAIQNLKDIEAAAKAAKK